MTLGQVIRRERLKLGWNQTKLAAEAGLCLPYISLVERDQRNPTIKVLFAIGNALGVFAGTMMLEVERSEQGEPCRCCGHIYGCYCVEYPHDNPECPGDWKYEIKRNIAALLPILKGHINPEWYDELERLAEDRARKRQAIERLREEVRK